MANRIPEKSSPNAPGRYFVLGSPTPNSTVYLLTGESNVTYFLGEHPHQIHVSKRTMRKVLDYGLEKFVEVTHVGGEPASLVYARQIAYRALYQLTCAVLATSYRSIASSLLEDKRAGAVQELCAELDVAREAAIAVRAHIEQKFADLGVTP